REHLEAARHVESVVRKRHRRRRRFDDVEPASASALEHPRRKIDAFGLTGEARDALEQETRAASDFEDVPPGAEAPHELGFELVQELVVPARVIFSPVLLIARGKRVVIGAVRLATPGTIHRPSGLLPWSRP